MPTASARLHHVLAGPADAPLLVLGPSLGTSTKVWEPHLQALGLGFRTLCFDLPGHGRSPSEVVPHPEPGRTTMVDLARLVLDLVDLHGHDRFHYAGISIGGAIGGLLAARHPERVASLAMVAGAARFGDPDRWTQRAAQVRREGTGWLLEAAPGRWFGDPDTATTPRGAALLGDLVAAAPEGYAACCDAIAGYDLRPELGRIAAPTLVVAGSRDTATPPGAAEELLAGIPGAVPAVVDAGHIAATDEAPALTARLLDHLSAAAAV
ncbi:alpha/beta fold hydrolase [Streptacidiphilus jiangxiensis]|uniref:3-oxoadipate enol-lactonase/3-oxoadipate enol-lactonase / 4-carboxymuconolactone decarboxylase n=1 Tax=Streptacidiphilus jiangxiensis TaxID=235985 RepID=A0A1H7VNX1_STRJI|nr:alpha/beta fold hydrolase [Streptacidiphilus jiangxiensis]SEM10507.1 3-oxoadipate enol-lactonase/3-oxoadipate enol-lactonase / 4-carboxymuconolactone decarboxylase [Streptacidiphilus jiangxiensis]